MENVIWVYHIHVRVSCTSQIFICFPLNYSLTSSYIPTKLKMTSAYLWILSVLGCFLLVLSAPVDESALMRQLRESAMHISENDGFDVARRRLGAATGQTYHVTNSPVADTSTHYGVHRVDRQVLFQHDATWCVARPVKQVIEHPGCSSRTIDNKVLNK